VSSDAYREHVDCVVDSLLPLDQEQRAALRALLNPDLTDAVRRERRRPEPAPGGGGEAA
jgi:hypothetical protein